MIRTVAAESTTQGMSTVMTHKAFGKHAEESLRAVRDEAVRLEKLLSRFIPESEISRINRSAGQKCERLSSETFEVLSRAVEFSRYSQGLFDVTIGPLVTLWSKSKDTFKPPKESWIMHILPLVDYTSLLLDPCEKTAGLQRIGQSIDLGGIGKGFAGDKFLEVFKKYGIASAFLSRWRSHWINQKKGKGKMNASFIIEIQVNFEGVLGNEECNYHRFGNWWTYCR